MVTFERVTNIIQNVIQLWLFQVAKILYLFKKEIPFSVLLINGSIVFE